MTTAHIDVAHALHDEPSTDVTAECYAEFAAWWDFAGEEDLLIREVERWESVATPTARDLEARDAGLARAHDALSEHRARGIELEEKHGMTRAVSENATTDSPVDLADLFDDVTVPELETMFPADGKWAHWAERASDNGLKRARRGRGLFNPWIAAEWFRTRKIPGWARARIDRVLANNLPSRSHHMRSHLLP